MPGSRPVFQLEGDVLQEIARLAASANSDPNVFIRQMLLAYRNFNSELAAVNDELRLYKERELEAFVIGDALSDGIYIIDQNEVIVAVNKAFTKMTGIPETEIVGQSVQLLVDKKITAKPVGRMVLEQKKKISIVATLGSQKIVATGNPIFNDKGEVSQVLTVMRDVTELLKLQEQLEYSEKLSEKYLTELNYFRKKEILEMGMTGQSQTMNQLKELVIQVAEVDVTVLITGETGVGKEVVAREICKNSPRKDAPYIKVNCAAIPETLLESELFGYEKGAFTGAQNKEKLGLFEIANSGTILLDEIGEMPLNLQTKLLRVLQEKEIIRLGGSAPIKLDVRVIAATNQRLEEQVKAGKFREDLFYRLNVVPIKVPPLRNRTEDISLLADEFLKKYNEKYGKKKRIELPAVSVLEQYDWPGNVRELQNMMERLVVTVNENFITGAHILNIIDHKKMSSAFEKNNLPMKDAVAFLEKQMIENALKTCGSTHKAARVLGVSQPTVLRKAKEYGLIP